MVLHAVAPGQHRCTRVMFHIRGRGKKRCILREEGRILVR